MLLACNHDEPFNPMSRYQLELAIALTASSITSAGIFYLVHRNQDGKIKLLEGETQDPFDVTRPVDFVDGFPIEEASFWSEVCLFFAT